MRFLLNKPKFLLRTGVCLPLLAMILLTGGCSTNQGLFHFGNLFGKKSPSDKVEKPAEELAKVGMQKMQAKKYDDALKAFKQLKEHYPYSKYAILAELKIGDANYYKKEYSDAAVAYEEFARLHPRNEVVPYVLYQLGMCHFLEFSDIARDQAETQQAIESFRRVIQTYPDSEYGQKAKKQILECEKRIVAHEYFVGQFYCRREKWKSAKDRLEKVLKEYPDAIEEMGYKKDIDKMLAECEKGIAKGQKGPSVWTRMGF